MSPLGPTSAPSVLGFLNADSAKPRETQVSVSYFSCFEFGQRRPYLRPPCHAPRRGVAARSPPALAGVVDRVPLERHPLSQAWPTRVRGERSGQPCSFTRAGSGWCATLSAPPPWVSPWHRGPPPLPRHGTVVRHLCRARGPPPLPAHHAPHGLRTPGRRQVSPGVAPEAACATGHEVWVPFGAPLVPGFLRSAAGPRSLSPGSWPPSWARGRVKRPGCFPSVPGHGRASGSPGSLSPPHKGTHKS